MQATNSVGDHSFTASASNSASARNWRCRTYGRRHQQQMDDHQREADRHREIDGADRNLHDRRRLAPRERRVAHARATASRRRTQQHDDEDHGADRHRVPREALLQRVDADVARRSAARVPRRGTSARSSGSATPPRPRGSSGRSRSAARHWRTPSPPSRARIAMTTHRLHANQRTVERRKHRHGEGCDATRGALFGWPVEPQRLREHGLGRGDHALARSRRADRARTAQSLPRNSQRRKPRRRGANDPATSGKRDSIASSSAAVRTPNARWNSGPPRAISGSITVSGHAAASEIRRPGADSGESGP